MIKKEEGRVIKLAIVTERSHDDFVLPEDLQGYFQGQDDLLAPLGALNAHHPASLEASIRVARACVKMAEHLGFDGEQKEVFVRAATLHDIGKICVDPEILEKCEPFTAADWRQIEKHPSHALNSWPEILEDHPCEAAMILRHHNLNRGYGKEEEILVMVEEGQQRPVLPDLSNPNVRRGTVLLTMVDVCDASAGGRPDNPLGDSPEVTLRKVQAVIERVAESGLLGEDGEEELGRYRSAKDFLLSLLEE